MKKFRTLSLALVIFFAITGVCVASGFDLSSIKLDLVSTEDLIALKDLVENELAVRGIYDNDVLETGFYVVGKDIVSGSFTLSEIPGKVWTTEVTVYSDLASKMERKKLYEVSLYSGNTGMILDDGNVIEVRNAPCICKINEAKKSWAP